MFRFCSVGQLTITAWSAYKLCRSI